MAEIKLYGEDHLQDNLFHMYRAIFSDAQKSGIKNCFIEAPPIRQAAIDDSIEQLKSSGTDLNLIVDEMIRRYAKGNGPERRMLKGTFIALLSAMTDVKVICADVAPHSRNRLLSTAHAADLNPEATTADFMRICLDTDPASLAAAQGCSIEEAKQIIFNQAKEIIDGSFYTKAQAELTQRKSQDPIVAEHIASLARNTSAIVIYGSYHVEPDRPDSITNILADKTNAKITVYDISEGRMNHVPLSARSAQPTSTQTPVHAFT